MFPRLSSPRETFSAVVKWFDGQVSRQWLMCSTVKVVSRSSERDVDVNKSRKWFDGNVSRQCLMCSTVKVVSRSIGRDVDVNEKSHRSSRKGHTRLPLYVPNVFEGVSVLQRDKRSRKTSKTLAKLLA